MNQKHKNLYTVQSRKNTPDFIFYLSMGIPFENMYFCLFMAVAEISQALIRFTLLNIESVQRQNEEVTTKHNLSFDICQLS